jgi:hypothetical protein
VVKKELERSRLRKAEPIGKLKPGKVMLWLLRAKYILAPQVDYVLVGASELEVVTMGGCDSKVERARKRRVSRRATGRSSLWLTCILAGNLAGLGSRQCAPNIIMCKSRHPIGLWLTSLTTAAHGTFIIRPDSHGHFCERGPLFPQISVVHLRYASELIFSKTHQTV